MPLFEAKRTGLSEPESMGVSKKLLKTNCLISGSFKEENVTDN